MTTTPGPRTEPRTEAGRAMLYDWQKRRTHPPTEARQESYRQFILAIEAEARADVDGLAPNLGPEQSWMDRDEAHAFGFREGYRLAEQRSRADVDGLVARIADLGWTGLPQYAIAYAAAIRDVLALLAGDKAEAPPTGGSDD